MTRVSLIIKTLKLKQLQNADRNSNSHDKTNSKEMDNHKMIAKNNNKSEFFKLTRWH